MRIQEEETSWLLVDVFVSYKVERHMVFASSDSYVLMNLEKVFYLWQILRLYAGQTQSAWY